MGYIVRDNVSIVDETCNALFFTVNEDSKMKAIIDKFDKLGLDNEKYIKKEMKNLFRFLDKFKAKNKISNEVLKRYFTETNDGNTVCVAKLLTKNMYEDELEINKEKVLQMEDGELRERVMKEILSGLDFAQEEFTLEDEFKDIDVEKEFMPFLINKCGLNGEIKWYITMIVQEPKIYFVELIDIIIKSIEVFKETFKVMEEDVEEIVKDLKEKISANKKYFSEVTGVKALEQWDRDIYVQPSMINFNAVSIQCSESFIFGTQRRDELYFGWQLQNFIEIAQGKDRDEELLNARLKCLSDKSKFKILKLLKEKPMFGQEIATALELTTATVSYHMNALLSAKLIYIERIENKIFYTINDESIEEILGKLAKELRE